MYKIQKQTICYYLLDKELIMKRNYIMCEQNETTSLNYLHQKEKQIIVYVICTTYVTVYLQLNQQ